MTKRLLAWVALTLALTHTYESLDSTTRVRWRRRIDRPFKPIPGYMPMVSMHVPAYNEPLRVVRRTLDSLAALEYPNYEVIVVDNNTPDEELWRKLEKVVHSYGKKFKYVHLDQWPGYKSGALNFALAQSSPDAEIIGVVDADYEIKPDFLRDLTPGEWLVVAPLVLVAVGVGIWPGPLLSLVQSTSPDSWLSAMIAAGGGR